MLEPIEPQSGTCGLPSNKPNERVNAALARRRQKESS